MLLRIVSKPSFSLSPLQAQLQLLMYAPMLGVHTAKLTHYYCYAL